MPLFTPLGFEKLPKECPEDSMIDMLPRHAFWQTSLAEEKRMSYPNSSTKEKRNIHKARAHPRLPHIAS